MNEKITAVVVTRNRVELLKRCIESLISQNYTLFEIVIIDNASTDDTQNYLKNIQNDSLIPLKYSRLNENIGGAGGFSYGMKIAMDKKPDWIMLLDDDAEPKNNYISELMKYHQLNINCGCLIGTEFVGNTDQRAYGGRRRIINWNNLKEICIKEDEYNKEFFHIDTAVFVGFTVSRTVVEKIGYPDADFFIYYDDTEYSLRIRKITDIICVPSARINHRSDFKKDILEEGQKEWRRLYLFRNNLVIKKRFIKGSFYRHFSMFYSLIHEVFHILKTSKKTINQKKYLVIKHVFNSYYDVYKNKLGKITYVSEI